MYPLRFLGGNPTHPCIKKKMPLKLSIPLLLLTFHFRALTSSPHQMDRHIGSSPHTHLGNSPEGGGLWEGELSTPLQNLGPFQPFVGSHSGQTPRVLWTGGSCPAHRHPPADTHFSRWDRRLRALGGLCFSSQPAMLENRLIVGGKCLSLEGGWLGGG